MKQSPFFLLVGAWLFAGLALGEPAAVYPKATALRPHGYDQCNTGSCGSEAQNMALENAFATRGLPVRLSRFYRHEKSWSATRPTDQADLRLKPLSPASSSLLAHYGGVLPDFLFPEDSEGIVDTWLLGDRPTLDSILKTLPIRADEMGFSMRRFTFSQTPTQRYDTTRDLAQLKQHVAAGDAVSLHVHPGLLYLFNERTGLLQEKYTKAAIHAHQKAFDKKHGGRFHEPVLHAVAVLGYDDNLYAGKGYRLPGALIVHNSWSHASLRRTVREVTDADKEDLKAFRLKLFSYNPPGVYAVPYDYILDLIESKDATVNPDTGTAGFEVLSLDYAKYAESYLTLKKRVAVVLLPFVCDLKRYYPSGGVASFADGALRKLKRVREAMLLRDSEDRAESRQALLRLRQLAGAEAGHREIAAFSYAKIPVVDGDRSLVEAFYKGAFKSYYCASLPERINDEQVGPKGRVPGEIWPPYSEYADNREFREAIEKISLNPRSPIAWQEVLESLAKSGIANKEKEENR